MIDDEEEEEDTIASEMTPNRIESQRMLPKKRHRDWSQHQLMTPHDSDVQMPSTVRKRPFKKRPIDISAIKTPEQVLPTQQECKESAAASHDDVTRESRRKKQDKERVTMMSQVKGSGFALEHLMALCASELKKSKQNGFKSPRDVSNSKPAHNSNSASASRQLFNKSRTPLTSSSSGGGSRVRSTSATPTTDDDDDSDLSGRRVSGERLMILESESDE